MAWLPINIKRYLNGGGPAGSTKGLLEYLNQSNNNADNVNPEDG